MKLIMYNEYIISFLHTSLHPSESKVNHSRKVRPDNSLIDLVDLSY